eukprot:TRINITY_DN660_c10_g1_i1.p1 TRINITY_DN660_c10_g1~~TRINITY_DN660_c10_g1_i1.p1  ORF type:complete len:542 (+),score=184.00 TRINITY_DN660_c10_g1_i1:52-1626(+)
MADEKKEPEKEVKEQGEKEEVKKEEKKEETKKDEDFRLNIDAPAFQPSGEQQRKVTNKHKGGGGRPHISADPGISMNRQIPNSSVYPPTSNAPGMNLYLAQQYLASQKQQQMLAQVTQLQRQQQQQQQQHQPNAVEALVKQAQASQAAQVYHRHQQQQVEIQKLTQQLQQQNQLHQHLQHQKQATLPTSPEALRALKELQQRKTMQMQLLQMQQQQQQQQLQALVQNQQQQAPQKQQATPTPPPAASTAPIIKIAGGRSVNFDELRPGASVLAEPTGSVSGSGDVRLMNALKRLTGRALNNLAFEQRAPRPKDPSRAAMQFVIKPANCTTATSFSGLQAGELNAFHQDLSSVLRVLKAPKTLHVQYGKWNWAGEPFMYLTCVDHKAEVKALDETVIPNDLPVDKKHPNDAMRYVSRLVSDEDKLKGFKSACFTDALGSGGDLRKLYSFFSDTFTDLIGYEVQIHNLCNEKAEFVVKTQVTSLPQGGLLSAQSGTILDWTTLPTSPEPRLQSQPLQGMLGLRKKQ